jgi:F-type H+-transporting ATPase subunit a
MEQHGPTSWLLQIPGLPHDPSLIHINASVVVVSLIGIVSLLANLALKGKEEEHLIPRAKPSLVTVVDAIMDGLYNMIEGTLGHSVEKHVPFIASLFLYVFFNNLLGLLPYSSSSTSSVNTTLALGISSFLYYNIMGIKEHGFVGYMKHFLMGLGPAGILIAVLEMVSHVIRPVSLGIRLFVNMFVDHAVASKFSVLMAWVLPVPLLLFGVFVCTVQAFVFTTISAVYVQMATEHEAH